MPYEEPYPYPPPPPDDFNQMDYYDDPFPEHKPVRRKRKKKSSGRKIIALILSILFVSLALFLPIYDGESLGSKIMDYLFNPYDDDADYADISLIRTIEVSINGGNIEYSMDIPMPAEIETADGSPLQEVDQIVTTPSYSELEKYGHDWMVWEGETNRDFTVQISYELRSYSIDWDLTSENTGTVNDIPDSVSDIYTDDEWLIQPSLSAVRDQAEELTYGMDSVYDMTEAIYDYMDDEFTYETGSTGNPKSCSESLSSKSGDCDDQSILLISLLRAVDIPAWLEFGVLYDPVDGSWGAHGWANVYIPTSDGEGGSVTVDIVNDQFMYRDAKRFTEWESDGDAEHLQDYYATMDYSYTAPSVTLTLNESYSGSYEPYDY